MSSDSEQARKSKEHANGFKTLKGFKAVVSVRRTRIIQDKTEKRCTRLLQNQNRTLTTIFLAKRTEQRQTAAILQN